MEASSLILITSDNRIILQLRDDVEGIYYQACWGLIGGAAYEGESPVECMVRECIEEIGWRPSYLRKVLEISEHCHETVFVSYIGFVNSLHCYEGQELKPFSLKEIENIKISNYHKRIINQVIPARTTNKTILDYKVLFYTKLLPPAFGGYVSAGLNLSRVLSSILNVQIVTDENIQSIFDNNDVFDLLIFNATYEKSSVFKHLSERCKQSWTFEHNALTDNYREEMLDRFNKASRVLVPSEFLKNIIDKSIRNDNHLELTVLPIPINSCLFSFRPHTLSGCVKFVTCCAIKQERNLDFILKIMKALCDYGLSFRWDVYGDTPFQGDSHYIDTLLLMAKKIGLANIVGFHKPLIHQNDISEVLHNSDFYIDFSKKETYGMAKIEAALTGTRMILPLVDNNIIFNKDIEYFNGSPEHIAKQIFETIDWCINNRDKDIAERYRIRESMLQFNDEKVSEMIKKLLYEAV